MARQKCRAKRSRWAVIRHRLHCQNPRLDHGPIHALYCPPCSCHIPLHLAARAARPERARRGRASRHLGRLKPNARDAGHGDASKARFTRVSLPNRGQIPGGISLYVLQPLRPFGVHFGGIMAAKSECLMAGGVRGGSTRAGMHVHVTPPPVGGLCRKRSRK